MVVFSYDPVGPCLSREVSYDLYEKNYLDVINILKAKYVCQYLHKN